MTPAFIADHPVYCAVNGAEILGFHALSREGAIFELEHMWVSPQYLRTGIGTMLFEHALRTARSEGGSTLRIASDPNAEGFYRRMGARRVGEIPARPLGRVLPLLVIEIDATAVDAPAPSARRSARHAEGARR